MFYLQLGHLDQVLPEGHNAPALETGEFCEENDVRFKKGLHPISSLHFTRKRAQNERTFLSRIREFVKFLQALLLVLLCLGNVLALQSSLIQSLVGVLIVH